MEYSTFVKLAAEFFGTAILMIFGNGAVANVELKNTKGHHAGWLNIAMGYGFGVMFPVLMFGGVSGAHINPAIISFFIGFHRLQSGKLLFQTFSL